MLKGSYVTKSYKTVTENRMARAQAVPGFPYISYNGAEALRMAYSFKVLMRDNLGEAVYRNSRRMSKSTIDMANKTFRDLVAKEYVKKVSLGHTFGNMYVLDHMGFAYLELEPYSTEYEMPQLRQYYAVNRVFSVLCEELRENYTLEWITDYGPYDAVCIVWENSSRQKALKTYVVKYVNKFDMEGILKQQKEISGEQIEGLPTEATLVLATHDMERFMLEVDKDTSIELIKYWTQN